MNTKNRHILQAVSIALASIILAISVVGHAQPGKKMVATGVTLNDVRVQILSTNESTGITEVRFSGEGCEYCDEIYRIDEHTQILTSDYQGPMDLILLADFIFIRGSARVIRADNWVQEVRYVEVEE